MPWLLNGVYLLLAAAISPIVLYRRLRHGKYRSGWSQKLWGHAPVLAPHPARVWLHAVSVGEVLLLRTLIAEIRRRQPDVDIVLSTTTGTGYDVAVRTYPELVVFYFPLDFSWSVRRALQNIQPSLLVLAELELWPNLILAAARQKVRLAVVNGRLSEKSFRGYRKLRFLLAWLLPRIDLVAVQNAEYLKRFAALGMPAARLVVTGSVKFDGVRTDRNNADTQSLRAAFGLRAGQPVFIAGSTQSPEEEIALQCWEQLRRRIPNLRLILVPRHRERFEEVANLVIKRGHCLCRRTATPEEPPTSSSTVLLLDTLGELGACWGLADVAFVGGSLTNRGGQNMIEPAAYGAAVVVGPNTRNFRDIVELLRSEQALLVVPHAAALKDTLEQLLLDKEARERLGRAAAAAVMRQQGAVATTASLLERLLQQEPIEGRPAVKAA